MFVLISDEFIPVPKAAHWLKDKHKEKDNSPDQLIKINRETCLITYKFVSEIISRIYLPLTKTME